MIVKKYKGKARGGVEVMTCSNVKCKCKFETPSFRVKKGLGKYCSIKCYNEHRSITKEDRLEKHKLYQKKYKYNLTKEEYYKMIEESDNKCNICGFYFTNKSRYDSPCVDHCHATNKIRGILCHTCNKALGGFQDNLLIIQKAIDYLNKG